MPKIAKTKYDGIYKRPDANGYWGSWTAADGRRVRRRFHVSTLEQARTALAAEKLKVEEQIKFGKPLPSEESFTVFAADFLKHQERRIASQVARGKISATEYERQRGIVENHLKPYFGQMRLASIRRKDVKSYIDSRTGDVSDATIIKESNVLKRMFNQAVELEKIAVNPAYRAQLPQAPEGRCRYLAADELSKVLKACPQWLQPIAGLAVALGTRRGELLAVRWEDINLKAGTVLLRRTKNGKKRPAFINDLATQVLASMSADNQKARRSGLLFPDVTPAQVTVAFVRACNNAGIEDFSFHDLRHTFASHLRMRGADLHDLQKLLGHSDPRMTNRYAHLSNEHLGNAAHRLDGALSLPVPSNEAAVTEGQN
jgi:integrase